MVNGVVSSLANRGIDQSSLTKFIWEGQGWGLLLMTLMSFFPKLFHYQEYLFVALLIVAVLTAQLKGRPLWVRSPIDLPLLLFVVWVLLTIPFAFDPAYSFTEWRKTTVYILVFYWSLLVLGTLEREVMIHRVLMVVVVGTAVVSIYALGEFIQRGGTIYDRSIRAGYPYLDFNRLCTYLLMTIPLVGVFATMVRMSWHRLMIAGLLLLAFLAMVFSYTRAGWLGLVAEGVIFGLLTGRRRLVGAVLGCCLLVGVSLFALAQFGYQRATIDSETFQYRMGFWQVGIRELVAHPVVGVGYGKHTFGKIIEESGELKELGHRSLHNYFLSLAMESGVPALILIMWVLVGIVKTLVKHSKSMSNQSVSLFAIALGVMVVGFSVRHLFDHEFKGSIAYLFWILVATGLTQCLSADTSKGKVGRVTQESF
jgi:heptosyltransferase-3/putative inorganic carbon (HCO3(-)) transporter